jgi:hypothetical protein
VKPFFSTFSFSGSIMGSHYSISIDHNVRVIWTHSSMLYTFSGESPSCFESCSKSSAEKTMRQPLLALRFAAACSSSKSSFCCLLLPNGQGVDESTLPFLENSGFIATKLKFGDRQEGERTQKQQRRRRRRRRRTMPQRQPQKDAQRS